MVQMLKHMRKTMISTLICLLVTGCTLGEEQVGFERDDRVSLVNYMLCISTPPEKTYYLSVISIKNKDDSGLRETYAGSELLAVHNKRCLSPSQWPVTENRAYTIHYTLLSTLTNRPSFRKVASIKISNGKVSYLPLKKLDYFPGFISE
ncbi:putative T6SS immunity periplasmic lipoprotein [Pantoea sp. DY-15]|uniref:putative T6SS immunity periplasmic lipoprotein n=2 Tax=unclassified Pantoea TaxID=2630326 RepID=UPI00351CCF4D